MGLIQSAVVEVVEGAAEMLGRRMGLLRDHASR